MVGAPVGRPIEKIEGFGPVADFARALRGRWRAAGEPTIGSMVVRAKAAGAKCSTGGLSEATNARKVPSARVTKAYLMGCNVKEGDPELKAWEVRRKTAEDAAKRFQPSRLSTCESLPELRAELCSLMTDQRLDVETLVQRLSATGNSAITCEEITEQLNGPRPLDREVLSALVIAMGGTAGDAQSWTESHDRAGAGSQPPGPASPHRLDDSASTARLPSRATIIPAVTRRITQLRARRGLVVALPIVVLVTLLVAAASVHIGRDGEESPVVSIPTQEPAPAPQPESMSTRATATIRLAALSTRVKKRREEPVAGRYLFIHYQVGWLSSAEGSNSSRDQVKDVKLWWDASLSGRLLTTTTEGQGSSRLPAEQLFLNDFHVPVSEPSDDPVKLATQLATMQSPELGAAGRLRAIATINSHYDLNASQRAAVLQLLADTPGITFRGEYLDRADRTGLAFSADIRDGTSITRDTLVFHESTGALLAHESSTIPDQDPGWPAWSRIPSTSNGAVPTP